MHGLKRLRIFSNHTWGRGRICGIMRLPNRGNFIGDAGKEGQRMDLNIYDGTPALSARQFGSGMNSRITSPARPWFRLATANKKLMERADVKEYLRAVEDRMYQILNQSNFYTQAALLYLEIGVFGTAVMHIKEDFKDIVRFHTYTIGEYYIEAQSSWSGGCFISENI